MRIRLLGGFSLEHEGGALPPLPTRTARSLLAFLLIHRDQPLSRERLAGTFWPDLPEARARRRLSHALWQLQQVLIEIEGTTRFVNVGADSVAFNEEADFWLDVDEFEELASGSLGEMRRAIELYRGDFLAGAYDDWLLIDQQRLRRLYAEVLRRITDAHKGAGELGTALIYARRLVAHDPLAEEAQREVMRLSFLLGEFNNAIQQYEFCVSILEEELGARPAAETTALYEMIVAQRAKGDRPFVPDARSLLFRPGAVPMVGRVEERAAVIQRMTGAFAGRGGVVLVEGPLGVGVTSFLRGLAEDAHWRGLGVLSAAARSIAEPYGLCRSALEDALSPLRIEQLAATVEPIWLGAASVVLPSLAVTAVAPANRLNPEDESDRTTQALTEVMLAFGTINPHVVFMDDVHLADVETLSFLKQAARRLHSSKVLVVLGYHSAEARSSQPVWEALQYIDSQAGTERLTLSDFELLESAELARLVSAAPIDGSLLEAIQVQTGGNPLLILEALRGLAHTQDPAIGITEVAADLLERRLRSVAPATLHALQSAAIFENPVPLDALVGVSGLAREATLSSVDDAVRRAFLVEAGGEFDFAHTQLKAAARGMIDDADLPKMHAAAARWVASNQPERYEELGEHLAAAGKPAKASLAFRDAAMRAIDLFAFDTATTDLDRALSAAEEAGIPDGDLFDLLLLLEGLLDQQGRRQQQGVILERARAAAVEVRARLEAARRWILYLGNTDRFAEAEAAGVEALTLAMHHGIAVGSLLAARGLVLSWSGKPDEAMRYLRQAVNHKDLDPEARAEVQYALGLAMSSLDDPAATDELDIALVSFRDAGLPRRVADVLGLMATNEASRGDVAIAETHLREALDVCRQIGFTQGEGVHVSNLAALHYLEGRPAEALQGFDAALASLEIIPDTRREAMTLNNAAFVRHRILGDDDRARWEAEKALGYYRAVNNRRGAAQTIAILASIEARRDAAAALGLFGPEFREPEAFGPWIAAHLHLRQAEVHLAADQSDRAFDHCQAARRSVELGDLRQVLASVERVASQIALAAERRGDAITAARESVRLLERGVAQPYLSFFALYRAAVEGDERAAALEEAYTGLMAALSGFTAHEQILAEAVPEHAAIIDAWATHHPIHRIVTLRAAEGPGTVEATLTTDGPEDRAIASKRSRRHHCMRRILHEAELQGGSMSPTDLASVLGVSVATIRRDLRALRAQS